MKQTRLLLAVVALVVILAAGAAAIVAMRGGVWRSEARFTGAATGGESVSPDGRWNLRLVWLEESDSDGAPRLELHLTDTHSVRHFRQTLTISDPESDFVNDEGDQRVHWRNDQFGPVAAGTVRIGSEVVKLPQ